MNKLNNHTDLGDVLIRTDLNVPMINNEITDKFRISKSINIINSIYESSRTITFTSHLGRPNNSCLLYTSPSPRDSVVSRMPSSA